MLNDAQLGAQYISDDVAGGLDDVKELISQLNMTKALAETILSISLPPLSYVQELAKNINDSIVPDTQVQEIVANATASYETAQQALELARNARLVHLLYYPHSYILLYVHLCVYIQCSFL